MDLVPENAVKLDQLASRVQNILEVVEPLKVTEEVVADDGLHKILNELTTLTRAPPQNSLLSRTVGGVSSAIDGVLEVVEARDTSEMLENMCKSVRDECDLLHLGMSTNISRKVDMLSSQIADAVRDALARYFNDRTPEERRASMLFPATWKMSHQH